MSDSHTSQSAPSAVVSRTGAVVFALLAVAGLVDCVLAVTELLGATDLAPQLGAAADVVVLVVGAVVVPLAVILARAFAREVRDRRRNSSGDVRPAGPGDATATERQPTAPGPTVAGSATPGPTSPGPASPGPLADTTRIDA